MTTYKNKLEWQSAAVKKYKALTSRTSSNNIMLCSRGKLVAVFTLTKKEGVVF